MVNDQFTNQPHMPSGPGPHGHPNPTYRGHYKRGCRCEACVEANKAVCKARYQRHEAKDPERRRVKWRKHIETPGMLEAHRQRARERSKQPAEKKRCRDKAAAVRELRRKLLTEYRLERGCADCGYRAHRAALDFDHTNGDKSGSVMRMALWSTRPTADVMAEIAKCEVVCANCHRLRTKARDPGGTKRIGERRVVSPNAVQARSRRMAVETAAMLAGVKVGCGCRDCGYRADAAALDFDHVRGEKLFELARAGTRSRSSIEIEITKCDVVCANCHRVRTYNRRRAAP